MTSGIIYIATGRQAYLDEAILSARRCKDVMPNLNITIFSDRDVDDQCFENCISIKTTNNGYLDKISAIAKTPYERTIFLDTDTYACYDFQELFTLLDKYDIAVALAEHRTGSHRELRWDYQTMRNESGIWVYPIANTGVIVYKNSERVQKFFANWLSLAKSEFDEYEINGTTGWDDQDSFFRSLHVSELREVVIPPEYNCRFIYPIGLCGKVKVLHGRASNLRAIAQEINREFGPRIWQPGLGLVPRGRFRLLKIAASQMIPARIRRCFLLYRAGRAIGKPNSPT